MCKVGFFVCLFSVLFGSFWVSHDCPAFGSWPSRQCHLRAPSYDTNLQLNQSLVTSSMPPLPQHILQAGQVKVIFFSGLIDVPVPSLGALLGY